MFTGRGAAGIEREAKGYAQFKEEYISSKTSNRNLNCIEAGAKECRTSMKGLDNFNKKIRELEQVSKSLDGSLAKVSFDPADPQSIDLAISQMEDDIDSRVGNISSQNEILKSMVASIKEQGRQAILERAAKARTKGHSDEFGE